MSKFEVINGLGMPSVDLYDLSFERRMKSGELTQKGLVVYAYHLCREGNSRKAQRVLNRVSPYYFENGIYKDLYLALLGHMLHNMTATAKEKAEYHRAYEYFVLIKNSFSYFDKLRFTARAQYKAFEKAFYDDSLFTNP